MQAFRVSEVDWQGTPVLELQDMQAGTAARIAAGLGANLFSVRQGEVELLRCPPTPEVLRQHATGYGTPVLMPPGRLAGATFRFDGREYRFTENLRSGHHMHGLVLTRPWTVAEQTADTTGARVKLVFRAADYPEVMAQFPHPFVLALTYSLVGQRLACTAQITNEGDQPMPFGLGLHPYFAAQPESMMRLGPARQWEMAEKVPTGRFRTPAGAYDLTDWQSALGLPRDDGYALIAPEADGGSRWELQGGGGGMRLALRASQEFGHWVIYNGGGGASGFICAEPWSCMANAFNLDLPAAVSGMAVIAPGEVRHAGSMELSWT